MILTVVIIMAVTQVVELGGLGYLFYDAFKPRPQVTRTSNNPNRPICVGGCNRQIVSWTTTAKGPVCSSCIKRK